MTENDKRSFEDVNLEKAEQEESISTENKRLKLDLDSTEDSKSKSNHLTTNTEDELNRSSICQPSSKQDVIPNVSDKSSRKDKYCWKCHKESIEVSCVACPRSFHQKCLAKTSKVGSICEECQAIMTAEEYHQSSKNCFLSPGRLSDLLKFAVMTIKSIADPSFLKPVDMNEYTCYGDYIVYPMDLGTIEKNIANHVYASTQSFLADVRWVIEKF